MMINYLSTPEIIYKEDEKIQKLTRREKRKSKEFGIWLNTLMYRRNVSGIELAVAINMNEAYISRLRHGKQEPSENVERLIALYFKQKGETIYSEEEALSEDKIFSVWLNNVLRKNGIVKRQIAEALGASLTSVRRICLEGVKENYALKYEILKYLQNEYNIDISKGESLLESSISECKKFGKWLKYEMVKSNITERLLAEELGWKRKEIIEILNSTRMPAKYAISNIVEVLQKYGSTLNQEEVLDRFYDLGTRYRKFGNWLTTIMEICNVNNIELAKKVGVYSTTISHFRHGRYLPSKKTADKIFYVFDSQGINTEEGCQIWKQLNDSRN